MAIQEQLAIDTEREIKSVEYAALKLKEASHKLKRAAELINGKTTDKLRANLILATGMLSISHKQIGELLANDIKFAETAQTARERVAGLKSIQLTTEQNLTLDYVSSQARGLAQLNEAIQETLNKLLNIAGEKEKTPPEIQTAAEPEKQKIENYSKEMESLYHHLEQLHELMKEIKMQIAREKIRQRQSEGNTALQRRPWWKFW